MIVFISWWSALEGTKWLNYLSGLIKSALVVVEAIDMDAQSTLVHCSDGWDRTPQLVSLAQLLLDPYYRTIKVTFDIFLFKSHLMNARMFRNLTVGLNEFD